MAIERNRKDERVERTVDAEEGRRAGGIDYLFATSPGRS
jgi:hypothetical protein